MTPNDRNPGFLARSLLNMTVRWPQFNPDDARGPPLEIEKRLEDVCFDLPHVLFFPDDPEDMKKIYGGDAERVEDDFRALCQALRNVKRTGRANRADCAALKRGEQLLSHTIAWVGREEDDVRAQLNPNHPQVIKEAQQVTFRANFEEGISEMTSLNYFGYLVFSSTRSALEIMRDGVVQINSILDKGPSSRACS